jgi:3-oxoacyl-[acyl-carrier-protein] synthase-1
MEWGSAQVSLSGLMTEPRLHLPCSHVGDTGAASGALGVCLAAQGLRGRWSSTPGSLVVSRSERGEVGSVLLHAVNT